MHFLIELWGRQVEMRAINPPNIIREIENFRFNQHAPDASQGHRQKLSSLTSDRLKSCWGTIFLCNIFQKRFWLVELTQFIKYISNRVSSF